jgi:5-methylcytosine-specific restriction protein A
VWDRFSANRDELARLALAIRSGASSGFPSSPEEDEADAEEGRLLYRRHRAFERAPRLRAKKKAQAKKLPGGLACEVCGFDFEATYGPLGHDFVECHHLVALSETGERITRLSDLALLCSNCHRMAHRRRPWPSIADLRALIGRSAT